MNSECIHLASSEHILYFTDFAQQENQLYIKMSISQKNTDQ